MKTATLILEFQAVRYESIEPGGERTVLVDQHKIEIGAAGPYLNEHGHLAALSLLRQQFADYVKVVWDAVMVIGKDDIAGLAFYTAKRPARAACLLRGPLLPQTIAEAFLRSASSHRCFERQLIVFRTSCRRSDRLAEDALLGADEAWGLYEGMAKRALTEAERRDMLAPWAPESVKPGKPRRWFNF